MMALRKQLKTKKMLKPLCTVKNRCELRNQWLMISANKCWKEMSISWNMMSWHGEQFKEMVNQKTSLLNLLLWSAKQTAKSNFIIACCLKITQNVSFEVLYFFFTLSFLKLTCLVRVFDPKFQVIKNSPNRPFLSLNETFSVNFKHRVSVHI